VQRGAESELLAIDGPFGRLARDLQGAVGSQRRLAPAQVFARPN
jgi:hypothetical protein